MGLGVCWYTVVYILDVYIEAYPSLVEKSSRQPPISHCNNNAGDAHQEDNDMKPNHRRPHIVNAQPSINTQPSVQATMQGSVNKPKDNSTASGLITVSMRGPPVETMSDEEIKAWID